MKKLILVSFFTALIVMSTFAQKTMDKINIIPEPVSVEVNNGIFTLPLKISVSIPKTSELDVTKQFLKNKLSIATGFSVKFTHKKNATISLKLNRKYNKEIGSEGYLLSVTRKNIVLEANTSAGLFYGAQTLVQLFPAEIESKKFVKDVDWSIPQVHITDYPKVGWRGMMFDCSRHFFTVDEVKQFIDEMARYKFNMFHWHLTDDEGWRIEIKSLPKLTGIGAWRVDRVGLFGEFAPAEPNEPKTYGGYYTQQQVKEIVAYASSRFVNIMPEIDVPGHSMAAIASYPELSCTDEAKDYDVRFGEPFMDWSTGSHPLALKDNTLCPANDLVYEFMDKVMTEIAQLFPFEYIHSGGDEAPFNYWEESPQVKELMKREGLKDMYQVQAYFSRKLEKIINSKGKKMMAWEEVIKGGIESSTAIMNWSKPHLGKQATDSKHLVVNSISRHAYLDLMQGDISTEAPVYAYLRLNQSYDFEPITLGLNPKYVLGGQANLWTEKIYNFRQVQYMLWPRGFAIAESLWSPSEKKNWNGFIAKTENHFVRFDYAEKKYSPAMYDPIVEVFWTKDKKLMVELTPEISGLDIYTSFDYTTPDCFYPKYTTPIEVPRDAKVMKVVTYKGKEKIGRVMAISIDELKKRTPKKQ